MDVMAKVVIHWDMLDVLSSDIPYNRLTWCLWTNPLGEHIIIIDHIGTCRPILKLEHMTQDRVAIGFLITCDLPKDSVLQNVHFYTKSFQTVFQLCFLHLSRKRFNGKLWSLNFCIARSGYWGHFFTHQLVQHRYGTKRHFLRRYSMTWRNPRSNLERSSLNKKAHTTPKFLGILISLQLESANRLIRIP